jgi:hypothetical protein
MYVFQVLFRGKECVQDDLLEVPDLDFRSSKNVKKRREGFTA